MRKMSELQKEIILYAKQFREIQAAWALRDAAMEKESAERKAEIDKQRAEIEKQSVERKIEIDKQRAEIEKQNAERKAEIDKQIAENSKQIAALKEETDKMYKKMGGIDDNIGFHAEQYFQNALAEKLVFGGVKYNEMIPNVKHSDKSGEIEFDIVLENGDSVALIEVKSRIHPKFVREFAENRVEKFRKYFPQYGKYKAYLGIAGFSFGKATLEEAKKYGIGIIRQVGNSVEIDSGKLKAY